MITAASLFTWASSMIVLNPDQQPDNHHGLGAVLAETREEADGEKQHSPKTPESATSRPHPSPRPRRIEYLQVGQGSFARVFAYPTKPNLWKRAIRKDSDENDQSIEREHCIQKLVFSAFKFWSTPNKPGRTEIDIQIPEPVRLIETTDRDWWRENGIKFPEPLTFIVTTLLEVERIPPLPQSAWDILNDTFASDTELRVDHNLSETNDEIVLPRICLDRTSSIVGNISNDDDDNDTTITTECSTPPRDNHPVPPHPPVLYHEHLQALDIDTVKLARQLGRAMCLIHWEAGIDGRGIKFVLGGSRPVPQAPAYDLPFIPLTGDEEYDDDDRATIKPLTSITSTIGPSTTRRSPSPRLTIWITSFSQSTRVRFNRRGLKRTICAFLSHYSSSSCYSSLKSTSTSTSIPNPSQTTTTTTPPTPTAPPTRNPSPFPTPNPQSAQWQAFGHEYMRTAHAIRKRQVQAAEATGLQPRLRSGNQTSMSMNMSMNMRGKGSEVGPYEIDGIVPHGPGLVGLLGERECDVVDLATAFLAGVVKGYTDCPGGVIGGDKRGARDVQQGSSEGEARR